MTTLADTFQRPLRDLRISVTDRCNFRCRYCMPAEVFGAGYNFLPKEEILDFGEIESVARLLVSFGVKKLRITGGEPLLRKDLNVLVEMLAGISGVEDIAMTTNGVLLHKHSEALKKAGLHRVTVSLDAMDSEVFAKMNGVGAKSEKVIAGIDAALASGLGVKINTVVQKGVNEQEILPLAKFAQSRGIPIRYIEYMDTGNSNKWKLDEVVPSAELLTMLSAHLELKPTLKTSISDTAKRYDLADDSGFEVGFISSVTKPFCQNCNRMRLSADGKLFSCLFAAEGLDIKNDLRAAGENLQPLGERISAFWHKREDRYSELRSEGVILPKQEMSYIGG